MDSRSRNSNRGGAGAGGKEDMGNLVPGVQSGNAGTRRSGMVSGSAAASGNKADGSPTHRFVGSFK